jgi:hypothetical protein
LAALPWTVCQAAPNPGKGDSSAPPAAAGKDKPEGKAADLSPALAELRDQSRRILTFCYGQDFNARNNTPGVILDFCLAFGRFAQLAGDEASAPRQSAIGCLCWNRPCGGYELMQISREGVMARLGYGFQRCPGQLLSMLAQWDIPADYEIRVGGARKTVADLARMEERLCREGADMALVLVGLSHYDEPSATWNNDLGEKWSVERLVRSELERKARQSGPEAIDRLMGLSAAARRRLRSHSPLSEDFRRVEQYLAETTEFAWSLQNADGSWNPQFLAARGRSGDAAGSLDATGYTLEWLMGMLSRDQLREQRVTKSVAFLSGTLANWQGTAYLPALSPRDEGAAMHALRALVLYDQEVFQPHDPRPSPGGKGK